MGFDIPCGFTHDLDIAHNRVLQLFVRHERLSSFSERVTLDPVDRLKNMRKIVRNA